MPRILSKNQKKNTTWNQEGRNQKLKAQAKYYLRDIAEELIEARINVLVRENPKQNTSKNQVSL